MGQTPLISPSPYVTMRKFVTYRGKQVWVMTKIDRSLLIFAMFGLLFANAERKEIL
jgi:hypothetical protein